MKKQTGAAKILGQQLKDHPRLSPKTRHVMAALADDEATPVWVFFGQDEAIVGRVIDRVRQAYEQSKREISRPTSTIERADIESIIKKAASLKLAIKGSLPGNWARLNAFGLIAKDMPPVPLAVGWHSLSEGGGYPLAITDVLDWAVELAKHHLASLPVRAVERQKGKDKSEAEITAFVRLLAWHFNEEFEQEHHTAIGHIANAVFDLAKPLDVKAVEGRLKGRKRRARFKAASLSVGSRRPS